MTNLRRSILTTLLYILVLVLLVKHGHFFVVSFSLHPSSTLSRKNNYNTFFTRLHEGVRDGYHKDSSIEERHIASSTLSDESVRDLLKQRQKARRARNFSKADEILEYLMKNNVFLNDTTKVWKRGGGSGSLNSKETKARGLFTESPKSEGKISKQNEIYVLQKLTERAIAKRKRDFDTADDIRDELRYLHQVEIDDSSQTYIINTKPYNHNNNINHYSFGGKRLAGNESISSNKMKKIEELVQERADAKKRKDYVLADRILLDLEKDFNVRVDDSKKKWHFKRQPSHSQVVKAGGNKKNKQKVNDRQPEWSESDDHTDKSTAIEIPEGITILEEKEEEKEDNEHEMLQNETDDKKDNDLFEENKRKSLELLTVVLIKEKLREAGLPLSGKKSELIDRLLEKRST